MEYTTDIITMIPAMMQNFSEKNTAEMTDMLTNLLASKDGSELSIENYNQLAKLSEEELKKVYADLGAIGKLVLGTEEEFLNSVKETKKIVDK
jgi:hypothetical protein